jgi:membrane-associated phospholipid phosphatase
MGIELQMLDMLQKIHMPVGDQVMCLITHLGDSGMIWILLTLGMLLLPGKRRTGAVLAAALCIDLILCNGILKNLVARVRPFDVNTAVQLLVKAPRDFSFPSGHTAASFTAVMALYLTGEKKLFLPALVLAVLIAFSRLYLYVHYPTDVLGGVFVGLLCGYLGWQLVQWVTQLMDRRKV